MDERSTRMLVLLRARHSVDDEAGRNAHLSLLPCGSEQAAGVVGTVCGVLLAHEQIEMVAPGVEVACTRCQLYRDRTAHPPSPAAASYREWGWPVTACRDQVLLALGVDAVALALPVGLVEAVTAILAARERAAPVLAHPGAGEHRVLLAGEPYGMPLPWPAGVHPVTGMVPLPPSATVSGPVRWHQPPPDPDLRACREIDVFGAVRTTLHAAARAQGVRS